MEEISGREQARALKEAQRQAKEKEREEQRAKKAEIAAKKEQARAQREALKHEKELEKEKKRQAKEEAEKKKMASIQKQACIMNKLFVKEQRTEPPVVAKTPDVSSARENVRLAMDREFTAGHTAIDEAALLRNHLDHWRSTTPSKQEFMTWGRRRAPKVDVYKGPRLQRDVDSSQDFAPTTSTNVKRPRMKLLRFHKCFRPAYYGTHSKKSSVIGPRHPLRKEPLLNYEIDSDDEWEEECPGESLSECDEDEEEDKMEVDEDRADGFVVPDGYFSEDEGVALDNTEKLIRDEVDKNKNIVDIVTERALKHNCPFIIQAFSQDSASQEGESLRESCLKALEIRVLADDISIEPVSEDQEQQELPPQVTGVKRRRKKELDDSALPDIVRFLQESTTQKMKDIVETLSQRFPGIPKSTLTSKVREVSCYSDNHWKVKDEILILVQSGKKRSLDDEPEEQDCPPAACINVMQKRCLPAIEA